MLHYLKHQQKEKIETKIIRVIVKTVYVKMLELHDALHKGSKGTAKEPKFHHGTTQCIMFPSVFMLTLSSSWQLEDFKLPIEPPPPQKKKKNKKLL